MGLHMRPLFTLSESEVSRERFTTSLYGLNSWPGTGTAHYQYFAGVVYRFIAIYTYLFLVNTPGSRRPLLLHHVK